MPHLLLIDDDQAILPQQVRAAFSGPTHTVEIACSGAAGLAKFAARTPDAVLLDLRLPDQSGLDVYMKIRSIDRRVPVVFVTMTQGADNAIEAMKLGAFDYLFKPVDLKQLQQVVSDAFVVSAKMREPAIVADTTDDPPVDGALVGNCSLMREVYKSIGRVSAQNVPVLISGESGTGKELVARAIYQHSDRNEGPFLALNCAAIPEQLLESELFGHEKGAFTGADRRRIGKFEQVNGGTLFLDEIGDMPLGLQAKMLRVIQEQQFERVGGNETIRTDVRLIAATHRDLKTWSNDGRYRADLYYRLSVFMIELPALRDRENDLELLVRHFVKRMNPELAREIRHIDSQTLEILRAYNWPGNIRELQSVLKQAMLHSSGDVLLPSFLPKLDAIEESSNHDTDNASSVNFEKIIASLLRPDAADIYDIVHRQLDLILLKQVLDFTDGNQHQAAKILGISRQTLRVRMRELGLSVTQSVEQNEAADV
ncbi:sigma-54-dependent transcriptional regulator [Schlesneria paludicola]|uniref:sigma-54-dependent transcriptional regulator n=1 Tax=Schlesneria paludicola TaxID=360056 RepID=UPI00029A80E9|nr:sigma-54 dependent transcriptional regulator [Schlesneria paludicola]